jgi:hypothetical protein
MKKGVSMNKENPKQIGSNLIDCKPQKGLCPNKCAECFYNRPGAFYIDVNKSKFPTKAEAKGKIVRINSGHDSNIDRERVIKASERYKNYFFNTSISRFDFPGPVVWTANPKEELPITFPRKLPDNIMFVRLRVSATNLMHIMQAVDHFANLRVPIVLTFMAYYSRKPDLEYYTWQVRTINSYWCPKFSFVKNVINRAKLNGGRLVTICGSLFGAKCSECRNCETYYWQTIKHMQEV